MCVRHSPIQRLASRSQSSTDSHLDAARRRRLGHRAMHGAKLTPLPHRAGAATAGPTRAPQPPPPTSREAAERRRRPPSLCNNHCSVRPRRRRPGCCCGRRRRRRADKLLAPVCATFEARAQASKLVCVTYLSAADRRVYRLCCHKLSGGFICHLEHTTTMDRL